MPKGTCSVATCDHPPRRRTWCTGHYQRWQKYGDPEHGGTPIAARQPAPGVCSVDGCDRKPAAHSLCLMHYKRKWKGKDPAAAAPTFAERFWAQVNKGHGCWEWTGSRSPNHYGRFTFMYKTRGAHRVSWELAHGEIPAGLDVLHHCDNPPCIRPDHLFLGTDADNSADKMAKGRGNNTHSGRAKKLTWSAVEAIRLAATRGATNRGLAIEYGVTPSMIWNIRTERSWDPAKRRPMDK